MIAKHRWWPAAFLALAATACSSDGTSGSAAYSAPTGARTYSTAPKSKG